MSGKQSTITPDAEGIARAADILRNGGLVAMPTETVYGLAARADSADAVAQIYRTKGRPDFNPLIVHVASLEMARDLAQFNDIAERLAAKYWPGPLTLVLPVAGRCKDCPGRDGRPRHDRLAPAGPSCCGAIVARTCAALGRAVCKSQQCA